jgi:phosphatidylglycerol:prolipoprotein diacylglycerol transferase
MYAAALTLSAAVTVGTTGLPFFHLGTVGPLPIQWFGAIVAVGVLVGAAILRRYAEWHQVSDDHIRGLTGWITVTGFLGAHWLDMIMYQGDKPWFEMTGWKPGDWPLVLKLWEGISSYGGFVGGALGFFFYVWWKRLPGRLMADIAIIGLLPAFSIGRIGCTVVSDHIGGYVDPSSTFAFLAQNYPRNWNNEIIRELAAAHPGTSEYILAWNLGFIELLYLIPVNALILWLGFRKTRSNAGFMIVLTGVLYAPVRFFLDYLRPEVSDTRHFGFTFAQWASMLAFGGAVYLATRVFKNGAPAETMAPTSKEAQEMLRVALKDADEVVKKDASKASAAPAKNRDAAE